MIDRQAGALPARRRRRRCRLVAVEGRRLKTKSRRETNGPDDLYTLENLRVVVIGGRLREWAHHGIIGPERNDTATERRRDSAPAHEALRREHHFAHDGVRMPPVDESLTPDTSDGIAARRRRSFDDAGA